MNDLQDKLFDSLEGTAWHGHYFSAICCFHNDSRPSLMVYPDYFICKACGKRGNLQKLQQKINTTPLPLHVSIKPSVLPRWRRWEKQFGNIEDIAMFANNCLLKNKDQQHYYKERKIDQFIDLGKFGSLDGWYTFPIFNVDGDIVNIVVRAGNGKGNAKYVLCPIAEEQTFLYVPNWSRVLKSDKIYVPFGIIDSWSFEELDLAAITGTAGMSVNPESLKSIPGYAKFYIVPDKYEEKAAWKLANSLGMRATVLSISYPEGTKDPDEIRRKLGNDVLYEYLQQGKE